MYQRKGRMSFYFGKALFWLRVRNTQGMPRGFFVRIGKEV